MADLNIQIPSLSAASSASDSDLMVVRQGLQDKKILMTALRDYFLNGKEFTAAEILALLITVDGAGSSLDADLLDGQHGSHYLNAANLTGTVPQARLNAASILNLLLTVDGAGSSLDADLLDGQHGSYYRNASNLNAGSVPEARLPSSSTTAKGIIEEATQTEVNTGAAGSLAVIASTLRNGVSYSLGTTGYIILPSWLGNLTIQWGQTNVGGDSEAGISFPINFTTVLQGFACQGGTFAINGDAGAGIRNLSTSSATLRNGSNTTQPIRWFVIGIKT